jgi:hypothetical protein
MIKSRFSLIHNFTAVVEKDLVRVLENNFSLQREGFYEHMAEWVEKARQRVDFLNI